jgi:uncharacterized protein YdaU (DUF1376 family)
MASNNIPYFRFYPADFMNGVRGLSAQEIGVYTMLLCRIYESSGPVEYNPLRLATYCGMRQATFDKVLEKLVDLDKLQMAGGMISNARAAIEISKRANDLKLNSKAGKASAEKRQQNQRLDATDVQRTFNHTDTDTDIEKEEGEPSSKKQTRRCRLPEGWVPSERNIQDAYSKQFTDEEIKNEADKFRDYHAAKATVFADWDAGWRTWIGNARKFSRGISNPNSSALEIAFAARAARSPSPDCF